MQIRRVDTEILGAVRKQSSSGSRAKYVHLTLTAANAYVKMLCCLSSNMNLYVAFFCRQTCHSANLTRKSVHHRAIIVVMPASKLKCSNQVFSFYRQDLDKSKLEIQELFGKINEIRRKAEQSEVMVQEICRDIKKLDYAKKHLTATITALRRLAMLINAVGES